ncbi:MAG: hypothetical protein ACRD2Z_03245 [Thermoanaerobaculia bacterium]
MELRQPIAAARPHTHERLWLAAQGRLACARRHSARAEQELSLACATWSRWPDDPALREAARRASERQEEAVIELGAAVAVAQEFLLATEEER